MKHLAGTGDFAGSVNLDYPVFRRGGGYADRTAAGVFAILNTSGPPNFLCGFRVCLAF